MNSNQNKRDGSDAKRDSVTVITIDDSPIVITIDDDSPVKADNPSSSPNFEDKRDAASRWIDFASPETPESFDSAVDIDVSFEEEKAHNNSQASDFEDSGSDISEKEVFSRTDFDVSNPCSDTESDESLASIDLTSDDDDDDDDDDSESDENESDEFRPDSVCDVQRDIACNVKDRPKVPSLKVFELTDKNFGHCKICSRAIGGREKFK